MYLTWACLSAYYKLQLFYSGPLCQYVWSYISHSLADFKQFFSSMSLVLCAFTHIICVIILSVLIYQNWADFEQSFCSMSFVLCILHSNNLCDDLKRVYLLNLSWFWTVLLLHELCFCAFTQMICVIILSVFISENLADFKQSLCSKSFGHFYSDDLVWLTLSTLSRLSWSIFAPLCEFESFKQCFKKQ